VDVMAVHVPRKAQTDSSLDASKPPIYDSLSWHVKVVNLRSEAGSESDRSLSITGVGQESGQPSAKVPDPFLEIGWRTIEGPGFSHSVEWVDAVSLVRNRAIDHGHRDVI